MAYIGTEPLIPQDGGTGVSNTGTITLGGNLTTSGAFASTFTMTNTTGVTFPTSGTLATTSQLPANPVTLATGGTNANLTADNGAVFYSSATAAALLASTATANKALMSGASGPPTWSTPTFPNASATTRKIIVSDGTNWVASTETYAVPGTSGNVLTSDGTNWTSAGSDTSWTPTILGASTAGTATYSAQIGKYSKIGPLVFVTFILTWTSGTGTGNLLVGGLPVNIINTAGLRTTGTLQMAGGATIPANTVTLQVISAGDASQTQLFLQVTSSAGNSGGVQYSAAGSAIGSIWYFAL